MTLAFTALGCREDTDQRFICEILSGQNKGTRIVFDSQTGILTWGSGKPKKMILHSKSEEPLEIVAVSEDRTFVATGLRIFRDGVALRFAINAGDSIFAGTCVPG